MKTKITLSEFTFTFQYVSILMRFGFASSIAPSIYIPICFYFNEELSVTKTIENTFTFQYVSILIQEETFDGVVVPHLHSNMFLF